HTISKRDWSCALPIYPRRRVRPADARLLHLRDPGDADRLRPHPHAAGAARPRADPGLGRVDGTARRGPGLERGGSALARGGPQIHRSRWMSISQIPRPPEDRPAEGNASPGPAVVLESLRRDYLVRAAAPGSRRRRRRVVRAVDEVSLRIDRGETVGFVGANGAGKSTTIKMMTGILQPTGGSVRVLGRDPVPERRHLAREIGV